MKRIQMMTVAMLTALSLVGTACTDNDAEVETESGVAAPAAPANSGALEGNESPGLSGSSTAEGTDANEDEVEVENKTTTTEAND